MYIGSLLNINNQGLAPSTVMNCLIRNNTFFKNGTSASPQGEVFVGRSQNNDFYNNIIHMNENNTTNSSGVVAFCGQEFTTFNMDYNIFYRELGSNTNWTDDSCSPNPSIFFFTGNTNSFFANPNLIDPANDDFNVSDPSPAINAGMPNTVILDATTLGGYYNTTEKDFGGNDRIFDGVIDIGAYEYQSTLNNNEEQISFDLQIYPNPSKGKLQIELSENVVLTDIKIYDAKGQMVLNSNSLTIYTNTLSAGIYIVEAITNKGIISKKIILK